MRKEQHHAEVYLGQHLGVRSEHPDISGYFTAQESLWSASGVKVYEHNGSTLVEVDFGRKKWTTLTHQLQTKILL